MIAQRELEKKLQSLKKTARKVRYHIIDMIYTAQSGHPGSSLSAVEIMVALYFEIATVDPDNPRWADRDRILLSKGHGCPVWYACLALRGFFPKEELKKLRQFESILQGHPDKLKTPGVDMTTGSLGQGLSLAVGMALEGKLMRKDYTVYVVLGDGELNEGQIWEAAMSAAKYKLDNLIAFVDANRLQMDGFTTEIMPMEPIDEKFQAFGWETLRIDGHDFEAILGSVDEAKKIREKPVCIVADTIKGKGVSFMENIRIWHGQAPNEEEYKKAIKEITRA
jgi:transketolase